MISLRPDKNVCKFLISTPSRFIGEFESANLLITHAWSSFGSDLDALALRPGPFSRSYYVIVWRIPGPENQATPNYRPFGERFCACLGFLFGKRFDFHGLIESDGRFYAPDLSNLRHIELSDSGPYNHNPRKDLEIALNLTHFGKISSLFLDRTVPQDFLNALFAAARFYHRSLQIFDLETDVAYLDLITCGEILCNHTNYPDAALFTTLMCLEALGKLRVVPEGGKEACGKLISSLRQINEVYPDHPGFSE